MNTFTLSRLTENGVSAISELDMVIRKTMNRYFFIISIVLRIVYNVVVTNIVKLSSSLRMSRFHVLPHSYIYCTAGIVVVVCDKQIKTGA